MAGPLLIDLMLARGRNMPGGPMPKSAWATFSHAKYNAQRFVFDAEASEIAGDFAVGCPDLVFGNRQFAVPPYPLTYVEIDARAFFKNHDTGPMEPDQKDDTLAYLVDGEYVYCLFDRKVDGDVGTAHWRYRIVPPGQYAGQSDVKINMSETYRKKLLAAHEGYDKRHGLHLDDESTEDRLNRYLCSDVMFGSAVSNIMKAGRKSIIEATRECAMLWLDPTMPIARKGVSAKLMSGFMGDVRNYLALMLWLNQQSKVVTLGVPGGRVLVRGKPVTYMAHNTVAITLGRCKTVRRAFILANERNGPRRHGVKGHYRHRHGREGCQHVWPLLPNDEGHYICKACGRHRWRVEAYQRGDASRGYVTHDYAVGGPDD